MTRHFRSSVALLSVAALGLFAHPAGAQDAAQHAVLAVRPDEMALDAGSRAAASALNEELGRLLTLKTRSGRWGAIVVSLSRSDTLFASGADDLLQPASTMKLFTSSVALERLGPDHRFTTEVLQDGTRAGTTVSGNLYLRGGGDPSLSNRFYKPLGTTPMDSLAHLIAATGIRRVRGNLVADPTAFYNERIPSGWQSRYLNAAYAAPVAALSLNENVVSVIVDGDGSVTLEPATTTMPVTNSVRQVRGRGARISVRRLPNGGLEVRGSIGRSAGRRTFMYVVNDPVSFAGGALRASLAKAGVSVDGAVVVGATPPAATHVATLASPVLAQIVTTMNGESNNHFAELLFRNAARADDPTRTVSVQLALHSLRAFLANKVHADTTQLLASDGSGLSVNDHVTPRLMVELLSYAHNASWAGTLHTSLPVAGESETLRRRMRGTPAQGNLHAKTGTTNDVVSLAGYVTARDGEVIAFAFIYNGRDRWNARATIDQMGSVLADFIR